MEGYTAVITLLTDWTNGGYTSLKSKDVKRATVFANVELQTDTSANRYYLAMHLGRNSLPAVVLDYQQLISLKGKAPILYTVTREDYAGYLQDADERDRQSGGVECL